MFGVIVSIDTTTTDSNAYKLYAFQAEEKVVSLKCSTYHDPQNYSYIVCYYIIICACVTVHSKTYNNRAFKIVTQHNTPLQQATKQPNLSMCPLLRGFTIMCVLYRKVLLSSILLLIKFY